jgi:hypothetical protein
VRHLLSSHVLKHLPHPLVIDVFGKQELETYRVELRDDGKTQSIGDLKRVELLLPQYVERCFANPMVILNTVFKYRADLPPLCGRDVAAAVKAIA